VRLEAVSTVLKRWVAKPHHEREEVGAS